MAAKGTYAEKTFSPEKNNRNEESERYVNAREQELRRYFVNQRRQTGCETDVWAVTFSFCRIQTKSRSLEYNQVRLLKCGC